MTSTIIGRAFQEAAVCCETEWWSACWSGGLRRVEEYLQSSKNSPFHKFRAFLIKVLKDQRNSGERGDVARRLGAVFGGAALEGPQRGDPLGLIQRAGVAQSHLLSFCTAQRLVTYDVRFRARVNPRFARSLQRWGRI